MGGERLQQLARLGIGFELDQHFVAEGADGAARAVATPSGSTPRRSESTTMSAVACASCAPCPMAIETSAPASTGASLTAVTVKVAGSESASRPGSVAVNAAWGHHVRHDGGGYPNSRITRALQPGTYAVRVQSAWGFDVSNTEQSVTLGDDDTQTADFEIIAQ